MSTSSSDPLVPPARRQLTAVTVLILATWACLVLADLWIALRAVLDMSYVEWSPGAQALYEAAEPWLYVGVAASFVLGGVALLMGARWWQALMVSSLGILAVVQMLFSRYAPLAAVLFAIPIVVVGALMVLRIARPFGTQAA